jgi:hypothetical protein
LVLPDDGAVVALEAALPGVRRVGRHQVDLTLIPERPGVVVETVVLEPVRTGSP